jgi:tryptophan-rich sensory protein
MNKKNNKIQLVIAILIPLIVGGISAFITRDGTSAFKSMNQPPLAPPSWLFPVAWTILYILMGISSYFIYKNNDPFKVVYRDKALIFYILQLIFNFFWSIIFFNLKLYYFAFFWLLVMLTFIILLMINAKKVDIIAFYLLIPYILWVIFAGYLNIGIAILN